MIGGGIMGVRKQLIRRMLGTMVHVEVDRPIGYVHHDIRYPINYGYIPGLIAGDGEAQDAYILGVSEPLQSFDGQVIGAVRRHNDAEDKLVVAPKGVRFHQGQIADAVHFQEQFFQTSIDSLLRKSCGVVPFRYNGDQKEFLILLQTNRCWSFPKGHMDMGETETETALRELREETGLEATLIPDVKVQVEYPLSDISVKQVVLFLGEAQGTVVTSPSEIREYRWLPASSLGDFLPPDTVRACSPLLTFCPERA